LGKGSKWEYFKAIYQRYQKASGELKGRILDEFCKVCGYNRKYAICKLNGPVPESKPKERKKRRGNRVYNERTIDILGSVWEASGYLCSIRLKAVLPLWLPWIRKRFEFSEEVQRQLLKISPRQIDRRLQSRRIRATRKIYGRTKPGTLLKHHIPIRTDHWNIKDPGYTETDTVSHSGHCGDGLYVYTVNQTDMLTTWVESRAVLGKGELQVVKGLDEMSKSFPFRILGINPDNGSEFINYHLYRYCQNNQIQFTRSRPYKKDDNARIEQKNWTHVRKLFGWGRYDTQKAVDAMNDLYTNELRLFMNLFIPSMKIQKKTRIGSRIRKIYGSPKTPLERVVQSGKADPDKLAALIKLRDSLDPLALSKIIDLKLIRIHKLANPKHSPNSNSNDR
jgi:hypothetical protein